MQAKWILGSFVILVSAICCSPIFGGIVSTNFLGNVSADFDGALSTDTSAIATDGLSVAAADNNSFTQSDLNWAWDGSTLSGASLLQAEKTISARPGGDHVASSGLTFTFEVDSLTDFELAGSWGFNGESPGGDNLSYSLTGPGGAVFGDSSTGGALPNFSTAGTIGPGVYTLTFAAGLTETINNQGAADAGWTLDQFSLSPSAVPEPSGLTILFAFGGLAIVFRQRTARL